MNLSFDQLITFSRTSAATYVNSAGNVVSASANVARFDYDPATLAPKGLLIEEQRTNLLLRSEEFDNASWGKNAPVSITANYAVSPDGTADADRFVSTGGAFPQVGQFVTLTAGQPYTFSVWVKSDGTSQIQQTLFLDGSHTNFTPTATWTRISVTVASSTGGSKSPVIATNNPAAAASSFLIWGAQVELGSYATSYIPTAGSQVTRLTDVLSIGGSNFASFYNQAEWSVIVEAVGIDPDTSNRRAPFTIRRAAAAFQQDVYGLFYDNGSFNNLTAFLFGTSASAAARPSPTVSEPGVGVQSKIGFAFKSGDSAFCRDGGTVGTSSVAYPAAGVMDELRIGNENALDAQGSFSGWIRSIRYFPNRLTNAELQAATL